ncbi:type III secretion protein [Pseudomonas poae]|uniref:Type III secretion protein n=1 Tax=Pseudomonas poae TaxID=200451 RepID=A0A2S9EPA1_9PSED|nr:type III secretion protein [Pseudomonas poae]PRA26376.1 type III secretion protein [Pseudomonas poae]PRC17296.1 type III secretion protein [Pseudomonas poae]
MSLSELETLRGLRRHRADRAERTLREAKRQQQTLLTHIEQTQGALQYKRQQQAEQSAQLLSEHQGQIVTLQTLQSWSAKERRLCADTRSEEDRLLTLHKQKDAQLIDVQNAQKQVSQCLRQVEKLQELSTLLAEELP